MKTTSVFLAVSLFLSTLVVDSEKTFAEGFSLQTELTILSDYYSRGISQTSEEPTPQILSTLFHSSGFYAGIFASRVKFADSTDADQEVDFYTGMYKIAGNFNYRLGLIYYAYPNSHSAFNYEYNFFEFDSGIGYDFGTFSTSASLKFSPNYFAESGKETYTTVEAKVPVNEALTATAHIGYRAIENNQAFYNLPDNFDWSVEAEYNFLPNFKGIIKYVDSSFDEKTECPDVCSERVIAGLSYKF